MLRNINTRYHLLSRNKMQAVLDDAVEQAKLVIPNGEVATYIPELGKVDPNKLGICIYRLDDDEPIVSGDADERFTIQSVSKLISLAVALEVFGTDKVFDKVGSEPSGEAFNSLVDLDLNYSRPYNPLINSGALAISSMLLPEVSFYEMRSVARKLCVDSDIDLNKEVYESELKNCSRNKSIAYLLESKGIIENDVEETLRLYTKMCSLNVTARSLAHFGKILAADGVCAKSGKRLLSSNTVRIIKILMLTCGMYDGSGSFAIKVGIPSKSGVGGGLISVSDKRAGIGVFGPALDSKGNSIAGCELLEIIAHKLQMNLFYDPNWEEYSKSKLLI